MKRKICIVTGSRADYGLLRLTMSAIRSNPELDLQVIATGAHLSKKFGFTCEEILQDNFRIDYRVESQSDLDTSLGTSDSISAGIKGFSRAFDELKPDIIVLLGDRFEIFAASIAALFARIPVAHIHGGEKTVGAFDDAMRHSITKLSHIHFVAAEEYRSRVIQLGENPTNVHLVGGLGVDSISVTKLLTKTEVEQQLSIKFGLKNLLVTFHPVTLDEISSESQMTQLLLALGNLTETTLIFTMPNADTGGLLLMGMIKDFVETHLNSYSFTSMGHELYLSCINQVDGVIGNSSSGLTEVPTFKKGTIDIGARQEGRLRASSVIGCESTQESIQEAITHLYSQEFRSHLSMVKNPYGSGGASAKIAKILENVPIGGLIKKTFYDIPIDGCL